jgi:hypothetical protein
MLLNNKSPVCMQEVSRLPSPWRKITPVTGIVREGAMSRLLRDSPVTARHRTFTAAASFLAGLAAAAIASRVLT